MSETKYRFDLVGNHDRQGDASAELSQRPFLQFDDSLAVGGTQFFAGAELDMAIDTAIAVGAPLLLTGEPGTGKTTAAYYTRHRLGLETVLHFQAKSDSRARDLLYDFDTVRYFHDASLSKESSQPALAQRKHYLTKGPLWRAISASKPQVLLIDEIDKAPRDFPNDLLHELDQMEFTVVETQEEIRLEHKELRPIVFITSNSERRLPEPFLRRCVYHHIEFDSSILNKAVEQRRDQFPASDDFLRLALERFEQLRERATRKKPATKEYLVWLRVLSLRFGSDPEVLRGKLSELPALSVVLKHREDRLELSRKDASDS